MQAESREGSRRRACFVTLGASVLLAGISLVACDQILGIVSLHPAGDAAPSPPSCGDAAFATDPHNCGACGHDCLGGTCSDGGCGAVVVAANQAWPLYVAVNGGHVFWTTLGPPNDGPQGALMVTNVDGGSDASSLDGKINHPYSVITGGSSVYVDALYGTLTTACGNATNVAQVDPGCLDLTNVDTAPDTTNPLGLAADDAGVYWAGCLVSSTFSPDAGIAVGVWRTLTGSPTQVLATEPEDGGAFRCGAPAGSIAMTQTYIFFTDVAGNVRRIQKGGCDAGGQCSEVVSSAQEPALASDGTYLYWSDQNVGWIYRSLEGTPDAGQLVAKADQPGFVAVDAQYVYWSNDVENGAIYYAPKDGSSTVGTLLAAQQPFPLGLALVDGGVYWVNQGNSAGVMGGPNGAVMRIAKPL